MRVAFNQQSVVRFDGAFDPANPDTLDVEREAYERALRLMSTIQDEIAFTRARDQSERDRAAGAGLVGLEETVRGGVAPVAVSTTLGFDVVTGGILAFRQCRSARGPEVESETEYEYRRDEKDHEVVDVYCSRRRSFLNSGRGRLRTTTVIKNLTRDTLVVQVS